MLKFTSLACAPALVLYGLYFLQHSKVKSANQVFLAECCIVLLFLPLVLRDKSVDLQLGFGFISLYGLLPLLHFFPSTVTLSQALLAC